MRGDLGLSLVRMYLSTEHKETIAGNKLWSKHFKAEWLIRTLHLAR